MFLLPIIKQAVMITVFVLVMMLVIEYLSIQTKGRWSKFFSKNPWLQILFSALLGIVPGCLGTFAVVSMYIHRTIGLAALVTALIATSGDEAFIMFSMIPGTALKLMLIIFAVSILTGVILHLIFKHKRFVGRTMDHTYYHKEEPDCVCYESNTILSQLKKIIWQRAVILLFGIGFLGLIIFGGNMHEHGLVIIETGYTEIDVDHDHEDSFEHDHLHEDLNTETSASDNHKHAGWGWERTTFLIVTLIGLFITFTVPDHFLKKHLWGHVIKKHFLRLILWTFGAFLVLHFLNEYLDVKHWIEGNIYIVILIAALIGLIPESGPHIIFISLFAAGVLPFAVLMTNSIVQDGHGSIPLLAESGKSFIAAKLINALVGLIVGYLIIFLF